LLFPAPLVTTAVALRSGQLDLLTYIDEVCNRIAEIDPVIHALLPEADHHARLSREALALQTRFPDPTTRLPLYGIPVGVKDTFRVDGFPSQVGSQLPPELFVGPEATCVTMLREAGALILGKRLNVSVW
jgi:Asp-tRNA(Asn)/Glu-tRNA(Gln) amidotransferase A subunit family amidase